MQSLHLVIVQPMFEVVAQWKTHHPERSPLCWLSFLISLGPVFVQNWTDIFSLLPPVSPTRPGEEHFSLLDILV